MLITQKCQYALRAVFELAQHTDSIPVKTRMIAEAQSIPPRFLENILGQLRRDGIVSSRRGREGGHVLLKPPAQLTVGEVVRSIHPAAVIANCAHLTEGQCPLVTEQIFESLWEQAAQALWEVLDHTTFADLLGRGQSEGDV